MAQLKNHSSNTRVATEELKHKYTSHFTKKKLEKEKQKHTYKLQFIVILQAVELLLRYKDVLANLLVMVAAIDVHLDKLNIKQEM